MLLTDVLQAAPTPSDRKSLEMEVEVVDLARKNRLKHILHEDRQMTLYDFGLVQKVPICTMLDSLDKQHPHDKRRLLEVFVTQLPDVLEELRDNCLLYTDAKPSNVGIYGNSTLKLCDLDSVVRYKNEDAIPRPRLYTRAFAAQELSEEHRKTVSIQADVQAFARLLDEVLDRNSDDFPEDIKLALKAVVSKYNVALNNRPLYNNFIHDLRDASRMIISPPSGMPQVCMPCNI